VTEVSRDDDTGEVSTSAGQDAAPASGEPVGRINLPDEPPEGTIDDGFPAGTAGELADPRDTMLQKVLFGVAAVAMMVLALILMLQGVFEQKMPV
jgi:hypothetical protein